MAIRKIEGGKNCGRRQFKGANIADTVTNQAALVGRRTNGAVAGIDCGAGLQQRHSQRGATVVSQWAQTGISVIQTAKVRKITTQVRADVVSAVSNGAKAIGAPETVGHDGVFQSQQTDTVPKIATQTIAACIAGAASAAGAAVAGKRRIDQIRSDAVVVNSAATAIAAVTANAATTAIRVARTAAVTANAAIAREGAVHYQQSSDRGGNPAARRRTARPAVARRKNQKAIAAVAATSTCRCIAGEGAIRDVHIASAAVNSAACTGLAREPGAIDHSIVRPVAATTTVVEKAGVNDNHGTHIIINGAS